MLSKAARLTTKEFAKIMQDGREYRSVFFIIKAVPSSAFKFSPAAPKKLFSTAVSRNCARRQIYAAVREMISKRKARANMVVLVVKNKFQALDRAGLINELTALFVSLIHI